MPSLGSDGGGGRFIEDFGVRWGRLEIECDGVALSPSCRIFEFSRVRRGGPILLSAEG